jgi:hypothetical protein
MGPSQQKKYTFVHVTKSGGTAFYSYFTKHLSEWFEGNRKHTLLCDKYTNPILILRHPVERFLSMYKYWKNGSDMHRPKQTSDKIRAATIKDFIDIFKRGRDNPAILKEELYGRNYLWDAHYKPTDHWINGVDWKYITIIVYTKHLENIIPDKLCATLNIPVPEARLETVNVSIAKEPVMLDDEDIAFIKEQYAADYKLWDAVHTSPELFHAVIRE